MRARAPWRAGVAACLLLCSLAYTPRHLVEERGLHFDVSDCFFRRQSRLSRDLSVLASRVHFSWRSSRAPFKVLDACAGSGVRGCRYAAQGRAQHVVCNEAQADLLPLIEENFGRCGGGVAELSAVGGDASRLLFNSSLSGDYFDVVDVDTFSFSSKIISAAFWALRRDGLLYATHTDGAASSGRTPQRTFERFGCWTTHHPAVNEAGVRYLAAFAAQEAARHNVVVEPWFSLYSPHGPVFRTMLKLSRRTESSPPLAASVQLYAHCNACADGAPLAFGEDFGEWRCRSCGSRSYRVAGPLWTGPLSNATVLEAMRREADELGWEDAALALEQLMEEHHPAMPPYFFTTREIAKAAKISPPRLADMMEVLSEKGWRCAKTHVDDRALKTDASFADVVQAAREVDRKRTEAKAGT